MAVCSRWSLVTLAACLFACGDASQPLQLSGCTFHESRQCYSCGSCDEWDKAEAGCRGVHDCLLFCGKCFAGGYAYCEWAGGTDSPCSGWDWPRGTLDGCQKQGTSGGMDLYSCTFCPGPQALMGFPGRDGDGRCVNFTSGCDPADVTPDKSCFGGGP